MAVTSTIEYCTGRDLNDIYPHLSQYSLKRRLYGFTKDLLLNNFQDSVIDAHYLHGTGLCTEVFFNGAKLTKREHPAVSKTTLNGAIDADDGGAIFTSGSAFGVKDLVKINNEYMLVTTVSTNSIVFTRGILGTPSTSHADDASVYLQYDSSAYDLVPTGSDALSFLYDPDIDMLVIFTQSEDPNDNLIETGDDWATIKTRFIRKASRLIESHLDSRMPREIIKDREGNYPAIIVHATALQTVLLLLKAHDPANEIIEPFQSELNEILDGLKAGTIVLPSAVSSDSSKGVIRQVTKSPSSDLYPVELKGNYHGFGYDNIKVKVTLGGVIGTSTYSVWVKDNDTLKNNQVVTDEKITGDYDLITSGLYLRWSGDDVATAITTTTDEYEIQVHSSGINSDISSVGSISMTRR